jgi:hypothetical protein
MVNYGIIYKLSNNYLVYYGSTIQSLNQRFNVHKQQQQTRKCSSNLLFKGDVDVKCEVIENFQYNDIQELRNREDYYIQNYECVNTKGSKKWNRKENDKKNEKELKEKRKIYDLKNKEYIRIKQKEANFKRDYKEKIKCDKCGSNVNKLGIYRHKKTKKCLNF